MNSSIFLIFVFKKASASTTFYTGITESMHAYGKVLPSQ